VVALLTGCGGDSPPPTYKVGGVVSGLTGTVVLQNGADHLSVAMNGAFAFPSLVASGQSYDVSVLTQPASQTCAVSHGNGSVSANVTTVGVACTPDHFTIGGSVSGLSTAGLRLTDGSDSITVAAGATSLGFPTPLETGASYAVTIAAQPSGELCNVASGAGTVAAANISDIAVTCAAHNVWALMNTAAQMGAGHYGTKGVAGPDSLPPVRSGAMSWIDGAGNLWLFGGGGPTVPELRNDLWKYTPSTNEWTWMSGSTTVGAVGVYGTLGIASPDNVPSARANAVSWIDVSGNLWLFGGGDAQGIENDLWKYVPGTNQWTWMGGSNTPGSAGVAGTQGVAAAGNVPAARLNALSWTDKTGNFWLFGGNSTLSDLWVYAPSTGLWTWVNGSVTGDYPVSCITDGTQPPPGCSPPPRWGAVAWTDLSGNFWLAFGISSDVGPTWFGYCTDLWEYVPSSGMWQWKGFNFPSVYAVGWTDHNNNLWSYGGSFDVATQPPTNNGLAEYNISTAQWSSPSPPAPGPLSGAGANAWTGSTGSFWLFANGYLSQYLP
jgi:Galactose oxidase, central domain